MLKERVKTSVIALLFVNLIFMTCRLWFAEGLWQESLPEMAGNLPIVRLLRRDSYSIPRERLSAPQKILINDGALWIAYYNSDAVFGPLENRTRQIIEGFLRGEAEDKREISLEEWQRALESVSVYVEYPITYSIDMLCAVMGIGSDAAPKDVTSVEDFIILPSDAENSVYLIVRDTTNDKAFIYRFARGNYSLTREDIAIYTENNSGYYEPAFSTGVEPESVSLDPMVLFSDSRPMSAALAPVNPLSTQESRLRALESFSNNVDTAGSYDDDGVITYVENYSDVRFYPVGLLEYKAVSEDKGVEIASRYASAYETVNAAIRFAENLWESVCGGEPLSMLVTSNLNADDGRSVRITMDYYYDGRPVAVSLPAAGRAAQMDHGLEIEIENGRIVSYRQLFRRYEARGELALGAEFVGALDFFVNNFSYRKGTVIDDIYIGYMDRGGAGELSACWLANIRGDDVTYAYEPREEDAQ